MVKLLNLFHVFLCVLPLRSEVKSQVDGVSVRVDRVERELEYLENKLPTQSDIEMEEVLLEQQIKAAELEQLKKKAAIHVENGRQLLHREKPQINERGHFYHIFACVSKFLCLIYYI